MTAHDNPDGDSEDTSVLVAERPAGGDFGAVRLSRQDLLAPRVVVDGRGAAMVLGLGPGSMPAS